MWIAATLIAAMAQTMRNAAQADLTSRIGTMGATGVRFLFGLPFALLFLGVLAMTGPVPRPGGTAVGYAAVGAVAQIAATGWTAADHNGPHDWCETIESIAEESLGLRARLRRYFTVWT